MLKILFFLKIFAFLSWYFGYIEKRLDKEIKFHFKIYDIKDCTTSMYNTHIAPYLKKSWIKYNLRNVFLQKPCRKWGMEASSRPVFVFEKSFK